MPAVRSARTVRSLTLLNTVLLTAAFSVPAFAQIETVVVTAERRAVDIQKVPVAVTAFTSKDRDRIGITSIQDMANFTPGMTYSTSTDRVTLRGISRQTNVLSADSGVANYSDGIFQSFAVEAGRSSLGVDRVEVLRGPQGTLYGRNSIGGAINIISKRPTDEPYAEFRVSYENYDHTNVEGTVSGPINDDWGYRLYGDWDRQGLGYTKNIIPGMPEEGNVVDTWYIEGQLQGKIGNSLDIWSRVYSTAWANGAGGPGSASGGWTPADYPTYEVGSGGLLLNPAYGCGALASQALTAAGNPTYPNAGADTTVVAGSVVSPIANPCQNPAVKDPWHIARLTPYTVSVPGAYFGTFQATYHTDQDFDIKYIGGAEWYRYVLTGPSVSGADGTYVAPISSYKITAEPFGACYDGLSVFIVGGAATCTPGNVGGVDNLTVNPQPSFNYQQQEFFTQNEVNFQSTGGGPLDWQAGIYTFFQHESQPVSASDVGQTALNTPSNVAVPEGPFTLPHDPNAERWYDDRPAFDDRSLAVYGQAGYKFSDEFKLTAGLRYSNDRKSGTEQSRLNSFGSLDGATGAVVSPENLGTDTNLFAFDLTPPSVGLIDYKTYPEIGVTQPACYYSACPAGTPVAPGFAYRHYAHASDAITGVVDLDWTPDDSTLVYAKYSRGYKGGGFNSGIFSYINTRPWVAPEHVNSFEIGAKKTFGDGWLVLDNALYYYDYSSMQIPVTVPPPPGGLAQPEFLNIPHAINAGYEVEAFVSPIEHLNGIVSYSYNFSQITSSLVQQTDIGTGANIMAGLVDPADPTASAPGARPVAPCTAATCQPDTYTLAGPTGSCQIDATHTGYGCQVPQSLKGQRLPNAPRSKIAINVSYDWKIGDLGTFTPSVTYRWVDKTYGTIFSRFYNMAPSWDQWDARVGFTSPDDHWVFYIYGKNLANTIGYAQGALGERYAGAINTGGPSATNTYAPNQVGYCSGNTTIAAPFTGTATCYFVQGESLGAATSHPAGYGAVRGESPYGTVSNYNVNPPALYGVQLQYKF